MKSLITSLFVCVAASGMAQHYPTIGHVVRDDPRLNALLPENAQIEVLASGFDWTEGPVWVKGTGNTPGYLLFSDVPNNVIHRWTEKSGVQVFLKPSGYTGLGTYSNEPGSNGLTIDRQGRLIACEHGDRRISAMPLNKPGGKITLADRCQGKRFNSPNDVVAHSNGSYYFTDPPYGLPKHDTDPSRETKLFGVYRIDPEGEVTVAIADLVRPNGVALSPDQKTLYVAQSDEKQPVILAYPILPDGTVGKGRLVYNALDLMKRGLKGAPDGLKVDEQGNLWATGPGGVLVIAPDPKGGAGTLLGRIDPGEATANCAWGDDGKTLYITADMYLCRIRTNVRGANW
ncbi:Gluconolactonase [Fibrella aestuarina BUZ 2]|uniref:Gluconolactonase n=2 Tax=Fibrella TaxID=861914 RepID=I0KAB9_9BACT|nr:Gluconolactonase [Fibrella aestuarina BUZ 2]